MGLLSVLWWDSEDSVPGVLNVVPSAKCSRVLKKVSINKTIIYDLYFSQYSYMATNQLQAYTIVLLI